MYHKIFNKHSMKVVNKHTFLPPTAFTRAVNLWPQWAQGRCTHGHFKATLNVGDGHNPLQNLVTNDLETNNTWHLPSSQCVPDDVNARSQPSLHTALGRSPARIPFHRWADSKPSPLSSSRARGPRCCVTWLPKLNGGKCPLGQRTWA